MNFDTYFKLVKPYCLCEQYWRPASSVLPVMSYCTVLNLFR